MKTLLVSVGGDNSRMRSYLELNNQGKPKYSLPLPKKYSLDKDLLMDIIDRGKNYFDKIILYTSYDNNHIVESYRKNCDKVMTIIDGNKTGPLGPMIKSLLNNKTRVFGCAGDYFHENFHWENFVNFHESHKAKISILASSSVSTHDGATFQVENNGLIINWERKEYTNEKEIINIGCYIMDYQEEDAIALRKMKKHKEDIFFDTFIPEQKIYAYILPGKGYNINTPDTYTKMLRDYS